jgi:cytoskeletal protein RodZ
VAAARSDFGGQLRRAREERGISLREIAATTKITAAALEGLERNDLSKLPGGIFSRALVRSYASEIGLDPDETVREFLERFQGEPATPVVTAVTIPKSELEFERRRQLAAWVFVGAVILMLIVGGVVLYLVLRARPASLDPSRPAQSGARSPGSGADR